MWPVLSILEASDGWPLLALLSLPLLHLTCVVLVGILLPVPSLLSCTAGELQAVCLSRSDLAFLHPGDASARA